MTGPYSVIYADPPWAYRDKQKHGSRGVDFKYPTLNPATLGSLLIERLCTPDAVLFMWATYPQLDDALSLIDDWGFTYSTAPFTWIKTNKSNGLVWPGSPLGSWTRPNAEIVLAGRRGHMSRVVSQSMSSVIQSTVMAPRANHSAKPQEVRDRIVQLTPGMRRIELFARSADSNFDCWGNECQSSPEALAILGDPS